MAFGEKPRRSLFPLVIVGAIVVGVGIGAAVYTGRAVGGVPTIVITSDKTAVGQRTSVTVVVNEALRGVVDVVVTASGAGLDNVVLAEVHHPAPEHAWSPPVVSEAKLEAVVGKSVQQALIEGPLTVTVTATRIGTWLNKPEAVTMTKTLPVKLTPPTVSPMSSFVHVAQGGGEAIVYEVGAGSMNDGVVVQRADGSEWTFVGSPLPGGSPTQHFALFAIPYDETGTEAEVKERVRLFAQDDVGNRSTATFVHKFIPRPMPRDIIELKDAFLQKVTAEIYAQTPEFQKTGDALADYLVLNRELRAKNNAFLVDLSRNSVQNFLWSQTFQPFDNASIMGAFADRRTYRYNGADVDTQDHLGFDLARVERTPVNAGNDGIVVYAAYLGIFGNCVVIDHGYGLMTLYAHLSAIKVANAAAVTRGQTIGLTGATGMAGGDHLHFTTLLHGRAVNPIEWWDGHWIADRLKLKLGDALPWTTTSTAAPPPRKGLR